MGPRQQSTVNFRHVCHTSNSALLPKPLLQDACRSWTNQNRHSTFFHRHAHLIWVQSSAFPCISTCPLPHVTCRLMPAATPHVSSRNVRITSRHTKAAETIFLNKSHNSSSSLARVFSFSFYFYFLRAFQRWIPRLPQYNGVFTRKNHTLLGSNQVRVNW